MEGVMNKRLLDGEVMSNVFFNMRTNRELWAPVDHMYDKKELLDLNVNEEDMDEEDNRKEGAQRDKLVRIERERQERSLKKLMKTRSEGFRKEIEDTMKKYLAS